MVWRSLLLLASASLATATTDAEAIQICENNAILKAIKDYSPDCIEACPQVCAPLKDLVMAVLMTGEDPVSLVCANKNTFVCMINGGHAATCKKLLDAAKDYVEIEIPREPAEFSRRCHEEAPEVTEPDPVTTPPAPAATTTAGSVSADTTRPEEATSTPAPSNPSPGTNAPAAGSTQQAAPSEEETSPQPSSPSAQPSTSAPYSKGRLEVGGGATTAAASTTPAPEVSPISGAQSTRLGALLLPLMTLCLWRQSV